MVTEQRSTALALPDEETFRSQILAINKFQQVVHATMVSGQDFGVIPGTTKPTLLKPGAEKITKLLGLSDQYDILDRQENWQQGFFRYLIKCRLVHLVTGELITEGIGECNSLESKYRWRWVGERDLPSDIDKSKLVSQKRKSTTGGQWNVYRLENDDIFSQVNTILKMSKKRALVDAALSAGRLSNVFTQDLEDLTPNEPEPAPEKPAFAKAMADKPVLTQEIQETIKRDDASLNKGKASETEMSPSLTKGREINIDKILRQMNNIPWTEITAKSWIKSYFKVADVNGRLIEVIGRLNREQQEAFCKHISELVGLK